MEPVRSLLLAAVAICGLAVIILSFMTWVSFEVNVQAPGTAFEARTGGIDTSVWRDKEDVSAHTAAPDRVGWCSCEVGFGDGYITAALGLLIVLLAGTAALTGVTSAALAAAVAGFATLVTAGFNAFADWSALVTISESGAKLASDGEVQVALYLIVALSALTAVLSTIVWATDRAYDAEEEYDDEDDDPHDNEISAEGTEAWA